MRTALIFLVLVLLASPSWAFVERLNPYSHEIPCHAIGAAIMEYVNGTFSAVAIQEALRTHYLTGLQTWTTQDNNDFGALASNLAGMANIGERVIYALRVEHVCLLAEDNMAAFDTPAELRTVLGLSGS